MECSPAIYLRLRFRATLRAFDMSDPFRRLAPDQFEPMATVAVDGQGEQPLAHEVNQSADNVDHQQNAGNLPNREWLVKEIPQVQTLPQYVSDRRIFGNQINSKRRPGNTIDDSTMERKPVKQQKHAETNHDNRQFPMRINKNALINAKQRQSDRSTCVYHKETETNSGHQPYPLERERLHIPLVCGNKNEQINEAKYAILIAVQTNSSRNKTSQPPNHQNNRHQNEMVTLAQGTQPLGKERQQR